MEDSVEHVVELANELTGGGYSESHDWGRFMYRKHHEFVGGLRVYFEPAAPNMPPVLVDAPGSACEFLGLGRLRVLFCNAQLSRADLAMDGAPFSAADMAMEVRRGNIRCKSQLRHFTEDLGEDPDGDTLTIGSRKSDRYLRIYDGRGFTRVELELKGGYARGALAVLLADPEDMPRLAVGVLRDFVDFVDRSQDTNASRAPLLPSWEAFTEGVARVRIALGGTVAPTAERLKRYIEDQVAASLYAYHRLGHSVVALLDRGRTRLRPHHRSVLTFAGVLSRTTAAST